MNLDNEKRKFNVSNMKWNGLCKFSMFSSLALALTSCSSMSNSAIRYVSPKFSGVVLDDYTGKPIEGATVQVSWSALRRTGNEHNPDMMDLCRVTTIADKHGIYKIPAWTNKVATAWKLYGDGWEGYVDNPHLSISIPKGGPKTNTEQIQFNLNTGGEGPSI